MNAGRELDALVAEHVMGERLTPGRERAMVEVGWRHISVTGRTFLLDNGESLPMPGGEYLPAPEADDDWEPVWNDRYALHVARHLGDAVAAEVDAVRLPAKPYSTNIAASWEVVEKMLADGWEVFVMVEPRREPRNHASVEAWHGNRMVCEDGDTAPVAICLAALRAYGAEVTA